MDITLITLEVIHQKRVQLFRQGVPNTEKPMEPLKHEARALDATFFLLVDISTSFGEVLYANVSLLRNRKFDLISQSPIRMDNHNTA